MNFNVLTRFVLMVAMLLLVQCGSGGMSAIQKENQIYKQGQWVDESTYRILAEGSASSSIKNPDEQKASASRSAIHLAQNTILTKFKEYRKAAAAGQQLPKPTKVNTLAVLYAIKNGTIVKNSEIFDKNKCVLVFEVKGKNLQKKVLSADMDSVDIIH